jgi:DNA-binding LacI/PurR family transcriptional regulator
VGSLMSGSPTLADGSIRLLRLIRIDPDAALPLSAQLQQQITWLIASGEVQDGDKLPPIRELAKHLGINMHTVRAAYQKLAADGLVVSRRGVGTSVAAHDLGRLAQRVPDLPSFTTGVLIPGLNPFYVPFLRGVQDAARDARQLLFICEFHDLPGLATRYVSQLSAKGVDGLILTSTRTVMGARGAELRGLPPTVYVDEPDAPEHVILLDSEGAGYRATTHLLEHGHRRIGLISGPLSWRNLRECYLGYQRALSSSGLYVDSELVVEVPAFTIEWGYRAAQQLLDIARAPSGIFGAADVLAIGAMQAIQARGKGIPGDVAVVGYNDIELAALVHPPLTTVSAPAYEMGVQAMTMLRQLHGGLLLEPNRIVLDTELVVRSSCGCQTGPYPGGEV